MRRNHKVDPVESIEEARGNLALLIAQAPCTSD